MRRRSAEKRKVIPDPKFGSELLSQFINRVMVSGKKSLAESIVYTSIDLMTQRAKTKAKKGEEGTGDDGDEGGSSGIEIFIRAIENLSPMVEVKSRRVGGATYQIPIEVPPARRKSLAMRWAIEAASKRGDKGMALRLAAELLDAAEGRGEAFKKKEDVHRMAKANQAFAHYRW
jgi:small subunit ribosomal protein S7